MKVVQVRWEVSFHFIMFTSHKTASSVHLNLPEASSLSLRCKFSLLPELNSHFLLCFDVIINVKASSSHYLCKQVVMSTTIYDFHCKQGFSSPTKTRVFMNAVRKAACRATQPQLLCIFKHLRWADGETFREICFSYSALMCGTMWHK